MRCAKHGYGIGEIIQGEGGTNNEEVEGLVEGTRSNDIERVTSWPGAGAGNAPVKCAGVNAGTESHANACECSAGQR